jgi:hypothetical protein
VLATVAMKGGKLISEVKAREDVRLIEVTLEHREGLSAELERWSRDHRCPRT